MDTEKLSVRILSTASRVLLVFITYALLLVATTALVATSGLVAAPASPAAGPEPLRGLPVVALADAGLLSWLVLRSRWVGVRLATALALAFFGVHTILPELEAAAVPGSFSRAGGGAAGAWFGGAVFAATLAAAAVVILRRTGRTEPTAEVVRRDGTALLADTLKIAAAALVLLIVHAAFGCRWGGYPVPPGFAFRGPFELLCPSIAGGGATGIELVRASVGALTGWVLVRSLRGGALETSLIVGSFSALAGPVHELLPLPLVAGDWASGQHWALAASRFVLGLALGFWFCWSGPAFVARRGQAAPIQRGPRHSPTASKGFEGHHADVRRTP